jgi:L-iditol 2-dehydrogenase
MAVVAVPVNSVVEEAVRAIRPGGRVLLFAQTRMGDMMSVDAGQICVNEKTLLGSYSSDIDLQPEVAELLFSRRIRTEPLVTHRFPLERIGEALHLASHPAPESLKVVVQP